MELALPFFSQRIKPKPMKIEAGTLHLEHNGELIDSPIVWRIEKDARVYAYNGDLVFMSISIQELKSLAVIARDIEIKGELPDA